MVDLRKGEANDGHYVAGPPAHLAGQADAVSGGWGLERGSR